MDSETAQKLADSDTRIDKLEGHNSAVGTYPKFANSWHVIPDFAGWAVKSLHYIWFQRMTCRGRFRDKRSSRIAW